MPLVQDLNTRFAIEGAAEVIAANGNLPAVTVKTASGATGTVYLHGAHVAAWTPEGRAGGEDLLFLSANSAWQPDKPIRGGVPICFPWFGPNKQNSSAPMHGFARLRQWSLDAIQQSGDSITVSLSLASDDDTRKLWPHDFLLTHRVTFGPELVMSLELQNTGTSPLTAEEALHTYLALGDVRRAKLLGLENTRYIDKADAMKEKSQDGPVAISAETDRIYLDTTAPVTIEDPAHAGGGRRIGIAKSGSNNTVVWNPWIAKAKAMPDFGDDEWPRMICVETCNVAANAIRLDPGQTHTMFARISVAPI